MKRSVSFGCSVLKRTALTLPLAACAIFFAASGANAQLGVGVNVTGRVAFEGVTNFAAISSSAPVGSLHLVFRPTGTTTTIVTQDVTLNPAGSGSPYATYTATNILPGDYDVLIKSNKNLAVLATGVLVTLSGTIPDQTLPAGDANNDNSVDATDFGILVSAYNTSGNIEGSGYDPRADFNFDGVVDPTDFGLFVGDYNTVGAS